MLIRPIAPVSTPAIELAATNKVADRPGFAEHLKASVTTANVLQQKSATAQEELATGRNGNIHETLIAMSKADVSFRMIMQVRNKIINAYQEVMRMQA